MTIKNPITVQDELGKLMDELRDIKRHPPNMYHWTPNDAWITAINACVDKVSNLRNKLL